MGETWGLGPRDAPSGKISLRRQGGAGDRSRPSLATGLLRAIKSYSIYEARMFEVHVGVLEVDTRSVGVHAEQNGLNEPDIPIPELSNSGWLRSNARALTPTKICV